MALLILTNCFDLIIGMQTIARAAEGDGFGSGCKASFYAGAVPVDPESPADGYVWNAEGFTSGHQFIYQISYDFSFDESIPADTFFAIVPAHVLRNRKDRYFDKCEPAYPKEGDTLYSDDKFVYAVYGDYVVIRNIREIPSEGGWFRIAYSTAQTNQYYKDMKMSDEFHACILLDNALKRGDGEDEAHYENRLAGVFANMAARNSDTNTQKYLSAPPFCINTYADIVQTKIVYPSGMRKTWPSEWGAAPADADQYYYVVFPVSSYVKCNQFYRFSLDNMMIKNLNGYEAPELYMYMMVGNDSPTVTASTDLPDNEGDEYPFPTQIKNEDYRIDKVLVRYKKNVYKDLEQYQMKFWGTGTVHPGDGIDPDTTVSTAIVWYYDKPLYK